MTRFVLIVVALLALVVMLAGPVIARRAHPPTDCANRVMTVKSPQGRSLECVCVEATMAACLKPGP